MHLIVGGHNHEPGEGVVNDIPIVRAGSNGRGIGVIDLHRRSDRSHAFDVVRQTVYADDIALDSAMTRILAPYMQTAAVMGGALVTTLAQPLSSSANGDRRLGTLIAEAARLRGEADFGLHNPGGVRISLPRGEISYAQLHRVMPFDNAVVRLTITGRQLRELAEQTGPRYYYANLLIEYRPDPGAPRFGRASLTFPDGSRILEDRAYTLATNDFLGDGGDALVILSELPREVTGVSVLDAVVDHFRTLPAPVTLPLPRR